MLTVDILSVLFIKLRKFSGIPIFLKKNVLIMKGCWVLWNAFSALNWEDHIISFPYLLIYGYTDWFSNIEQVLLSWINIIWSWTIILYVCCLILFANIFLRFLGLCSWKIFIYSFHFLYCLFWIFISELY